jgi:LmbE family N-acetylglucosaminyl deacetylase
LAYFDRRLDKADTVTTPTITDLAPFPDDWDRALAIVAHPDDLEYGAAGAIAAWTRAGKQVAYLLASRGEAGIDSMDPDKAAQIREAEQRDSAAIVGVTSVEFLNHPDGLIEYGLPLRRDLAAAIRHHRPHLVVTFNHHDTWPGPRWNTPDHRNTGRAALDAIGDAGNRHLHADVDTEPWTGVRYAAVAGSPCSTHAVDITDTLDTAVASLEAHRAYLDGLGPGNWMADARALLTSMAAMAGTRYGGLPAAAFELLRY